MGTLSTKTKAVESFRLTRKPKARSAGSAVRQTAIDSAKLGWAGVRAGAAIGAQFVFGLVRGK